MKTDCRSRECCVVHRFCDGDFLAGWARQSYDNRHLPTSNVCFDNVSARDHEGTSHKSIATVLHATSASTMFPTRLAITNGTSHTSIATVPHATYASRVFPTQLAPITNGTIDLDMYRDPSDNVSDLYINPSDCTSDIRHSSNYFISFDLPVTCYNL